jgi:peptidoglycan/LPS O-acetylase OafA/YrhL
MLCRVLYRVRDAVRQRKAFWDTAKRLTAFQFGVLAAETVQYGRRAGDAAVLVVAVVVMVVIFDVGERAAQARAAELWGAVVCCKRLGMSAGLSFGDVLELIVWEVKLGIQLCYC